MKIGIDVGSIHMQQTLVTLFLLKLANILFYVPKKGSNLKFFKDKKLQ